MIFASRMIFRSLFGPHENVKQTNMHPNTLESGVFYQERGEGASNSAILPRLFFDAQTPET